MVIAFLLSIVTILLSVLVIDIDLEMTMSSIKSPLLWIGATIVFMMHIGYLDERSQRATVKNESVRKEYILAIYMFPLLIFFSFTGIISGIPFTWYISNLIIYLFSAFDLVFFMIFFIFGLILFFTSCLLLLIDVMKFKFREHPLFGDMVGAIAGYWLMRVSVYGVAIKFSIDIDTSDLYLYTVAVTIIALFFVYLVARKVGIKTGVWTYSSFDTHINRYLVWSLRELPRFLKKMGVPSWIDSFFDVDYNASYDLDKRANELEYNNRYIAIKGIYVTDRVFKEILQDKNNKMYGPCGFLMELTVPEYFRHEERKRVMSCRIFSPEASIGTEQSDIKKSFPKITLSLNIPEKIDQTMMYNNITVISCSIYNNDSDPVKTIAYNLEIYARPIDLLEKFIVCLMEPVYGRDKEKKMSKWYLYVWSIECIEFFVSRLNQDRKEEEKIDKKYISNILSCEIYDWKSS